MFSSNTERLYHYIVEVKPDFGIKDRQRTSIRFDGHAYKFVGFSLFFHKKVVPNLPIQWLNRMFPEYSVRLFEAEPVEVGEAVKVPNNQLRLNSELLCLRT